MPAVHGGPNECLSFGQGSPKKGWRQASCSPASLPSIPPSPEAICGGSPNADWAPVERSSELQEKAQPSKQFRDSLTHVLAELRDTLIVEHERAAGQQEHVLRQEVHALRQEIQFGQGARGHKDSDMGSGLAVGPTLSYADRKGCNGEAGLSDAAFMVNPKLGCSVANTKQETFAKPQAPASTDKRHSLKAKKKRNLDRFRLDPNARKVNFTEELLVALNPSQKSPPRLSVTGTLGDAEKAVDDMELEQPSCGWLPEKLRSNLKLQAVLVDHVIGTAIVLNIILVGLSMDLCPEWLGWLALDAMFALFFFAESALRLWVLGCHRFFRGVDWKWNVFEAGLVAFAMLEFVLNCMWSVSSSEGHAFQIIRLLRIPRIFRVCRLRMFCDVLVMVKSTMGGLRVLTRASALAAVPLYALALVFRETLGVPPVLDDNTEHFSSVGLSFFTVFRCVIASDCSESNGRPIFYLLLESHGWVFTLLYAVMVVFMSFGLCNVIIALCVENVMSSTKSDDFLVKKRFVRDEAYFNQKVVEIMEVIWDATSKAKHSPPSASGVRRMGTGGWNKEPSDYKGLAEIRITPEFLHELRQSEQFANALRDLDVADEAHANEEQFNLFEMLDTNHNGAINLEELVTGLARLRGEARRSDIVQMELMVRFQHQELVHFFHSTLALLRAQDGVMRSILECISRRRDESNFALGLKLGMD